MVLDDVTATRLDTIGHWVGGRAVPGTSGRRAAVYDPARGVPVAEVDLASVAEVNGALEVAREAATSWADVALGRRAGALFRLRDLIERHADDLAALVTREHGKVLSDARGE